MLANRIALLKMEEMKTWKKIEETKKRADDIKSMKMFNRQKNMSRKIHEEAKIGYERMNQKWVASLREERNRNKNKVVQGILY